MQSKIGHKGVAEKGGKRRTKEEERRGEDRRGESPKQAFFSRRASVASFALCFVCNISTELRRSALTV